MRGNIRLSELQKKNIINLNNGKIVGKIIDIDFNPSDGSLKGLVIERSRYFKSVFNAENDVIVTFNQIKKIGEDVILIDIT